jgi:hypothetical protein
VAKAQRRTRHLERWQALLAAAVAAVASIVVALVGLLHDGGSSPHSQPTTVGPQPTSLSPQPTSLSPQPTTVVAITSWSEQTLPPPPGRRYVFEGVARNLPSGRSLIFVVAAENDVASGQWLVSPFTALSEDGRWKIQWDLPNPPAQARWMAVVWFDPCPPGGGSCAGNPYPALAAEGPNAPKVVAVGTAPSTPSQEP